MCARLSCLIFFFIFDPFRKFILQIGPKKLIIEYSFRGVSVIGAMVKYGGTNYVGAMP